MAENKANGKQVTISELAKIYQVSRKTLYKWKDKGVDIFDQAAVENHTSNLMHNPLRASDYFKPKQRKATGEEIQQGDDLEDLYNPNESIYDQIDRAENYEQARFYKMKSEAKAAAFKFEIEQGDYTKNSDIRENVIRIASAIKAGLLRYESDLPPMCEGLTAAKMQKVIRQKNNEVLEMFNNLTSELYSND